MKVKTVFVSKAVNYEGIVKDTKQLISKFGSKPAEIEIDKVIELTKEDFKLFKENLLEDMEFIKNSNNCRYLFVKVEGSNDAKGIIVESEGYHYARYTGVPIQEEDIHKCSDCGKYFIGYSAISRKDNKSEVCSDCGTKEAIQGFNNREVIEFCLSLQERADELGVKITVKAKDGFEMIINPD